MHLVVSGMPHDADARNDCSDPRYRDSRVIFISIMCMPTGRTGVKSCGCASSLEVRQQSVTAGCPAPGRQSAAAQHDFSSQELLTLCYHG